MVISERLIAWGFANRPRPGHDVSGDLHLVQPFSDGVLLAAVDGVGHGPEATAAASLAVEILERHAAEPLDTLVRRCHAALMRTRGVVMTVATLDPVQSRLAWLGVGNVEARLFRAEAGATPATDSAVLRNGLVGFKLPELRAGVVAVAPGDVLVFATDGIGAGFAQGWARSEGPQQIADRIMERHFKGTDDALVLVARYLGHGHE